MDNKSGMIAETIVWVLRTLFYLFVALRACDLIDWGIVKVLSPMIVLAALTFFGMLIGAFSKE